MPSVLHGKKGEVVFLEEPFSGSELGLFVLGESVLGVDEADANAMEKLVKLLHAYTWRIITDGEVADTSDFTQEWRKQIGGMSSWIGRAEAVWDTSDEGQQVADKLYMLQREQVIAKFYTKETGTYIEGTILATAKEVSTSIDDAERVAYDFQGSAAPTVKDASDLISEGLIAHWKFDDGSGTVAIDSVAYANNGTISGAPAWVAGKYNTALQFNGSAGQVSIPKTGTFSGHPLKYRIYLTISLWFKRSGAPSGAYHGLIGDDGAASGFKLSVNESTKKVKFELTSNSGYVVESEDAISASGWNHIVATYDANATPAGFGTGKMSLYLNNVKQVAETSRTGAVDANASPILIGNAGGSVTNGIIDDVRIYAWGKFQRDEKIDALYNL